jgi:hypothetical protein
MVVHSLSQEREPAGEAARAGELAERRTLAQLQGCSVMDEKSNQQEKTGAISMKTKLSLSVSTRYVHCVCGLCGSPFHGGGIEVNVKVDGQNDFTLCATCTEASKDDKAFRDRVRMTAKGLHWLAEGMEAMADGAIEFPGEGDYSEAALEYERLKSKAAFDSVIKQLWGTATNRSGKGVTDA